MARKSRKNKPFSMTTAEEVLQSLLQKSKGPLAKQFLRFRVTQEWSKIVGPSLAKYTQPVDYRNGFLYVWVKSSVYMQELSFLAPSMLYKINEFAGRHWVKRIHFTLKKDAFSEELNKDGAQFLRK